MSDDFGDDMPLTRFDEGRGHHRPRPITNKIPSNIDEVNQYGCLWGQLWAEHLESITCSQEGAVMASVQLARQIKSSHDEIKVKISEITIQIQSWKTEDRMTRQKDAEIIEEQKSVYDQQVISSENFKVDIKKQWDNFKVDWNKLWWTYIAGTAVASLATLASILGLLKAFGIIR